MLVPRHLRFAPRNLTCIAFIFSNCEATVLRELASRRRWASTSVAPGAAEGPAERERMMSEGVWVSDIVGRFYRTGVAKGAESPVRKRGRGGRKG